jgi:hypothetical protein
MDEPVEFRPEITLTTDEALDVLVAMESAIEVVEDAGLMALAVELSTQAEMITKKLTS